MGQPGAALLSESQNSSSLAYAGSSLVEGHISTLFPHDPKASRRKRSPPFEDSPVQRKKRKKKHQGNCVVSFAVDLDNKIVEQYTLMDEDRLSLTTADIADNWWSTMELRQIHQDAIRTADDYREKHASDSSREHIDQLFNVASQESSSLMKSDASHSSKIYISDQCRQVCFGLERQVYTSIRDYGSRYVKGILKVQSKLPADINPEMKARLLRARSLQLSKPSRMLAKFLALPLERRKQQKMQGNCCVSFTVDLDDKIVEQYIVMDEGRLSLTREDITDNWWSPMELRHIHQDAIRIADDYREKHASFSSQDIDQLFDAVSQESLSIKSGDSSCHSKIYISDQCRQVCRGLERQVYTSIRKYGRRFTKGILKVQSKLPADINPEMKARLLRATSLQLSKPSRILAKFLAYGDTVEVRQFLVRGQ